MSKTKRFETRSPEATITQGFRLETGRFQNETFRKNHREKHSSEQDERKNFHPRPQVWSERSKPPSLEVIFPRALWSWLFQFGCHAQIDGYGLTTNGFLSM